MIDGSQIEDEIVGQYDVVLSNIVPSEKQSQSDQHQFSTKTHTDLTLLQYIMRPKSRPYTDQGPIKSIQYKQQQEKLRIQYSLNKQIINFDENAPQNQIGIHTVDSEKSNLQTQLYICKFHEGQYYLSPIKNCFQMRTSFAHVDDEFKNRKIPVVEEVKENAKKRMVKVELMLNNPNDERELKKNYLSQIIQKQQMENWITYSHYPTNSQQSNYEIQQLSVPSKIDPFEISTFSKFQYLDLLTDENIKMQNIQNKAQFMEKENTSSELYNNPLHKFNERMENSKTDKDRKNLLPLVEIQKMDLQSQIEYLFDRSSIIPISILKGVISSDFSNDYHILGKNLMVRCLHIFGGIFVLKSEYLYNDERLERLRYMRNYVLKQMMNSERLDRIQLQQYLGCRSSELNIVLEELCIKTSEGWKIKYMNMTEKSSKNSKLFTSLTNESKEYLSNNIQNFSSAQIIPRDLEEEFSRHNSEIHTYAPIVIQKITQLLEKNGLATKEEIMNHLQELNIDAEKVVPSILEDICFSVQKYFALNEIKDISLNKYWGSVVKLFNQKPNWRKVEIKKELKEKYSETIPDSLLGKILKKIGSSQGGQWKLK